MSQSYPAIRAFLRNHYSDEALSALLAHAEDGRLSYKSCCCFIGIPTCDHGRLAGVGEIIDAVPDRSRVNHYLRSAALDGAVEAEAEFREMGDSDVKRIALLLPIIHEEIARRDAERQPLYTAAVKVSSSYNDWLRLHGPYEDAAKGRGEQP